MANKKGVEALNRTLQYIRDCNQLMGGVVVFLAGHFRQTLPVVPRACIKIFNLSRAQYLSCPLSDDQVTEILATNENFSLVLENTCDEPTCYPKFLDNINSSNNVQKDTDPSEEALVKSPNNDSSKNIQKGIKPSEEALIKSPNNDSSNNIQKGIEPSEEALIKSPNNDSSNNIQKGIEPSEEALIKSPNYDSSNNIQKVTVPSDEALVMSPDYYSSNDENEDYSLDRDDSYSSLSEYCESSEADSLDNEDVQNNVNQNGRNDDNEWQDITDTMKLLKIVRQRHCSFIVEEVIDNNKVMYFVQLFRRYQALLLEFGDCEIDFDFIKDYRPEILQKKIEKIFGDRVTIEASTGPCHQKNIYKTDIDITIMENNTKLLESKEDTI
ncbi:unnamed protein product [Euphydryas editha]|uniref:ATP-dependent DNA helicase n=1 Tax=Euphydryas editha TaxID=104508 RepID=A0AAU9TUD5_EUPED|nr:unnamed protein product [Euphydryas editha]